MEEQEQNKKNFSKENMEDRSKIGKLEKSLYSRKRPSSKGERDWALRQKEYNIKGDWQDKKNLREAEEESKKMSGRRTKKRNFLKRFFIVSFLFFIAAAGVASFVILGGSNIISSENVEVSFSGPVSISGGEKLSLQVIVLNKNNADLELVDLIIEYPEGTRSAVNLGRELPRDRVSLGDIKSGDLARKTIESVLFGEEGDKKQIKITVEYRVAGSNAIFFKEKVYEIEISSSPVNLSIESLKDIDSGKEINLEITLSSNSENIMNNLMLIVEYPFGFTFKRATPRQSFENNIWRLGDLSPGEERKIKITGNLEGQDNEERIFRFFTGVESEENEREIETAFVASTQSIFIKKPFISLDVAIDGKRGENVSARSGVPIGVSIDWQNNLPNRILNVEIEAKLSGSIIDKNTVKVVKGFYQSFDNTIVWSNENNLEFESVNPGERGGVGFTFRTLGLSSGEQFINPEVFLDISVRGRRLSESQVSEEVISSVKRTIRFSSDLTLSSKINYSFGPFSNSGPTPPKADLITTYTVTWSLSNSSNDVSEVEVSARLPSYVGWLANFTPSNENLSYNSTNGIVTWDVGPLSNGTGFGAPSREISFQISFLPSLSQVGTRPTLVGETELRGIDDFTGVSLDSTRGELTTRLSSEEGSGSGSVVK